MLAKIAFAIGLKAYLCGSNPTSDLHILLFVFLAAIVVQLAYLIVFLIAFRRKSPAGEEARVPVSVIVCAHDEAENLRELIPALLDQDYPDFEVIIVNDRSNDSTFDLMLQESKKDPRVRMVNVKEVPQRVNGKKYGLTLGIKAASHEWILLTDADCRPNSRRWIRSMSRYFDEDTQFVLGFSPYRAKAGLLNLFIRFETMLTAIQYFSFGWLGNPYMGVGRNLAYRKSKFLEEKGFNNFLHVTGGDDDLFVNQHATGSNTRLAIDADSQVTSIPKDTWGAFFTQKIRHLSVGRLYRFGDRLLLGFFGLSWIISWVSWVTLMGWWVTSADLSTFMSADEAYLIAAPFLLRWILLLLLFRSMRKRASLRFPLWTLPVLDIIYVIYYLSTGLVALTSKKIRWRN